MKRNNLRSLSEILQANKILSLSFFSPRRLIITCKDTCSGFRRSDAGCLAQHNFLEPACSDSHLNLNQIFMSLLNLSQDLERHKISDARGLPVQVFQNK